MKKVCWTTLVTLVCLGLLTAASLTAADKKPKKEAKPDAKAAAKATNEGDDDAEETPESQLVARLNLAYELADVGRETKLPEALITAAHILRELPPAGPGSEKPTTESEAGEEVQEASSPEPKSLFDEAGEWLREAKALAQELAAAKKMTPEQQAAISALAQRVEDMKLTRGAAGGPRSYWGRLKPGHKATYKLKFASHQFARVVAHADARLRLEVKNPDNHSKGHDIGSHPHVGFGTGDTHHRNFTITVKNVGHHPTCYRVFTN